MATITTQPPRFAGLGSASAKTASSWSRASDGSMVTRGRCRRSSRRFRSGSLAEAASASTASGKRSGMPWAWTAMRLVICSASGLPSRLGHAGGLHAHARGARDLEAHQFAMLGVARGAARHRPFLELLAVDGIDHARAAGKGAEDAEQASRGARQPLDGPRLIGVIGIAGARRDARQHAVADACDRIRSRACPRP